MTPEVLVQNSAVKSKQGFSTEIMKRKIYEFHSFIHSVVCYNRSIASPKAISPESAMWWSRFQVPVHYLCLKVIR